MALELPPQLQARLACLPAGLADHVERVRDIARELAGAHAIDTALADLTAAAHDVARHIPASRLLEEAERIGLPVNSIERQAPVLLHGPVGAAWLWAEGSVTDAEAWAGVHWHTTAHADLSPVGQVVFLADKLDPAKAVAYPFQAEVRAAAFASLTDGLLVFLDGALRQYLERGDMIHPASIEARNAYLLAASC
jgi:predicted HD superfamily hydrolase involved in NAD metabolism